jgi:hypothetical protein
VERRLSAIEESGKALAERLEGINSTERGISQDLAILKDRTAPKERPWWDTPLLGLLGVLVGGGVTFLSTFVVQDRRLKQEKELANGKAQHDIGAAAVEWKLKQLSQLYGPVRALIGQSLALYRQMNAALVARDTTRFRLVESNSPRDGREFQIALTPGDWTRFRTVLHIDQVYGHDFGVDAYFDEIVKIGGRIVGIIEGNAGYARPEEAGLMEVYAKYLAHFAVLQTVHRTARLRVRAARSSATSTAGTGVGRAIVVDQAAVFPDELQTMVERGFTALAEDVAVWQQKART